MLDKNFVRENLDYVRTRLAAPGGEYRVDDLIALDVGRRSLLTRSEDLRREKNEASEQIGKLKKEGRETAVEQSRVKGISSHWPNG